MQPGPADYTTPPSQLKNELAQASQGVKRSSHVTSASPAKRITFFKSGDAQFGGVRMAIHKRSFKCFDALLDDLSQKVPLPFGVRTITTPRGTHSINCLDQLEDGGCYLCSDRRPVKPINMEAAGKRPAVWHHSQSHNVRRKPSRPEQPPALHPGHRYHRHPKRIVLVKNNDPAVRRSIILSRRTARSLRVFMEEISELMQCHIRKLYTLDGRKIDSIQGLMQCPSVLVCVGREPFRPLLVDSLRKSSDEKLPGLGTRSRSSNYSEGQDSRKNVNFGLETRKSIIHPRWDSSNRSTRFSLSSEKSCSNGLNMSPGNTACAGTCLHAKESMMNDDIEKRVLVNKDGSLSVEMKVRFRLLNDETLQWSTEIKKSAGNANDCCVGKAEEQCFLPQGKSESFSEPESVSQSGAEDAYATKLSRMQLDESHCQNCCNHCQEYDIWSNPIHGDQVALSHMRHMRSSSSSGSCHKVVCKKQSVDSMRTMSRSSEDYTEHIVEKATCIQQTVEDGNTRVEYCALSRCCSRTGVCAASPESKSRTCSQGKCTAAENDDIRPDTAGSVSSKGSCKDQVSFKITQVSEERPVSTVSNSSKVLESLKEDQGDDDEDDDDIPLSISRASAWSHSPEDCRQVKSATSNGSANNHKCVSTMYHLSPRPPSIASMCSACSSKLRKPSETAAPAPDVPEDQVAVEENDDRTDGAASAISKISSTSRKSHRCNCRATSPQSAASEIQNRELAEVGEDNRAVSTSSKCSRASRASRKSQQSPTQSLCPGEDKEERAVSAVSASTGTSGRSRNSHKCTYCNGYDRMTTPASTASRSPAPLDIEEAEEEAELRSVSAVSARTNRSTTSIKSNRSKCTAMKGTDTPVSETSEKEQEAKSGGRPVSPMSVKTNASSNSRKSKKSVCNLCGRSSAGSRILSYPGEEGRAVSTMSVQTNTSAKPGLGCNVSDNANGQDLDDTERAASAMSAQTHAAESSQSHSLTCSASERPATPRCNISESACDENVEGQEEETEKRAASALSAATNLSTHSKRSKQCEDSSSERAVTPELVTENAYAEEAETATERATSSTPKSTKASAERSERSPSAASAKTIASAISRKSNRSNCHANERAATPESVISQSSKVSAKVKSSNKQEGSGSETPAVSDQETAENAETSEARPASVVSVSTRASTKSKKGKHSADSELEDNVGRAATTLSVETKASRRSNRSGKGGALQTGGTPMSETSPDTQRVTSAMSTRSKASAKSQHSISERALTPTSTVSISIGVPEGCADDADEDFESRRSQRSVQSTKSKSQSDRAASQTTAVKIMGGNASRSELAATPGLTVSKAEVASVTSSSTKTSIKSKLGQHLHVNDRTSSAMSTGRKKSPAKDSRPASKASVQCEKDPANEDAETSVNGMQNGELTLSDQDEKASSVCSKSSSKVAAAVSRPVSSASARSVSSKPQGKDKKLKNKKLKNSLQVKGQETKPDVQRDNGSVNSIKTKSSKKALENDLDGEGTTRPNSASQNCPNPPKGTPNISKRPSMLLSASGDSILSHSLSAADLLRENADNTRPATGRTKSTISDKTHKGALEVTDGNTNKNDNKSDKSSKYRQKKSSSSQKKKDISELLPSSLPNASPTEVVNEWLKNIPSDSCMYEVGDDFQGHGRTKKPQEQVETVEGQRESVELTEDIGKGEEGNDDDDEQCEKTAGEEEEKEEACTLEPAEPKLPDTGDTNADSDSKSPSKEALPKSCHSSVQVMKILLSSKLDRCNSLPEVSPVYGRKLSSSAKGLLDCLAKLQLVGLGPAGIKAKNAKYEEVMNILQSLWLSEPSDSQQTKQKNNFKNHQKEDDEYNPRSSSGVDVSSSSAGSGKSLGTMDQVQKTELALGRVTPVTEQEVLQELQEETQVSEVVESSPVPSPKPTLEEVPDEVSVTATPDIASRVQGSPAIEETDSHKAKCDEADSPALGETIGSNGSPKDETPSSSNKSSGNDSMALKSPEDTGVQDMSSETYQLVQRAQLTKRVSQDPDPIWVLNLLRKLEKQFMTHYVNAMAEFKVRWDLDDSVLLDTMINELRDEVHKRIQASIDRELKKIQSRAGKSPRPPIQEISRESTLQTEQRRRRLKVMRNKSINPSFSRSEENFTATATDYSDQRSEDEYCPCETCVKKKMASRVAVDPEFVTPAPVLMAFDLRKILQMKQQPAKNQQQEKAETYGEAKDGGNQNENDNLAEEKENEEEQGCDAANEEEGLAEAEAGEESEAAEAEAGEESEAAEAEAGEESEAAEAETGEESEAAEADAAHDEEVVENADDKEEDEAERDEGNAADEADEGGTGDDEADEADEGETGDDAADEADEGETGDDAADAESGEAETAEAEAGEAVKTEAEDLNGEETEDDDEASKEDDEAGEAAGEEEEVEEQEVPAGETVEEDKAGQAGEKENLEEAHTEEGKEQEDGADVTEDAVEAGEDEEKETKEVEQETSGQDGEEENQLSRQLTKSSILSQQGSVEDSLDREPEAGNAKGSHGN